MTGNVQRQCDVARARAKKDTLYTPAHFELAANHCSCCRRLPRSQRGGSLTVRSDAARAANALFLACNASRRACPYARSESFRCALSRNASAIRKSSAADCSAPAFLAAVIACRASLISCTGGEVPQPAANKNATTSRPRADAPKNAAVFAITVGLRTAKR